MSATGQCGGDDAAGTGALDLVVVAASFGGLPACRQVLERLPADLPTPLVIIQHRSGTPNVLATILRRQSALPVEDAQAGDKPRRGVAFVAEPARQLVLGEDGSFEYAPARSGTCRADPFLASAAAIHGERMLAVVLTGRLDDAMRGIVAVKAAGGHVLAQDRETCAAFEMPGAAIATGCVDFVLPPRAIAAAIVTLSMMPAAHELFRVSRPPWALPAA